MASPMCNDPSAAPSSQSETDEESMPAGCHRNAVHAGVRFRHRRAGLILFGFVFLIGVGDLGHNGGSTDARPRICGDRNRRPDRAEPRAEHRRPHRSGNHRSGCPPRPIPSTPQARPRRSNRRK